MFSKLHSQIDVGELVGVGRTLIRAFRRAGVALVLASAILALLPGVVAADEPFLTATPDYVVPADKLSLVYDITKGGCGWGGELSVVFEFLDVDSTKPELLGVAPLIDCVATLDTVAPEVTTSASRTVQAWISDPLGSPIPGTEAFSFVYVDVPAVATIPPQFSLPPDPVIPPFDTPAPDTTARETEGPKPGPTESVAVIVIPPLGTSMPSPAVAAPPSADPGISQFQVILQSPWAIAMIVLVIGGLLTTIGLRVRGDRRAGRGRMPTSPSPEPDPIGVGTSGRTIATPSLVGMPGAPTIVGEPPPVLITPPARSFDGPRVTYIPTGGDRREPSRNGCDFSRASWTAEGDAFAWHDGDTIPSDAVSINGRPLVPIGGDYWHVPYRRGNGDGWWGSDMGAVRDSATGNLTSREFVINFNYISFLMAGTRDQQVRVELLVRLANGTPSVSLQAATPHGDDRFRRVVWDVTLLQGQIGAVRLIDESATGHLDVADLRCSTEPPDPFVSPVWGWADLHAHPMANWGFGGRLIAGSPAGRVADLYSCEGIHGVGGTGVGENHWAVTFIGDGEFGHRTHGWPEFDGWPKHNSQIHQTMHWEWVRRAYDGGQRLLVALAVNSELLATQFGGQPDLIRDWDSIDAQISRWRATVPSWAEIALTPADARRIIGEDRLAIVLGIEIDRALGRIPGGNTIEGLRRRLRELREMGVRQLNPIHFADNAFGHPAVYGDLFNVANAFLGSYYQVEGQPPGEERDRIDFRLGEHEGMPGWVARRDLTAVVGLTLGGAALGAAIGAGLAGPLWPLGAIIGALVGGAIGFGLGSLSRGGYQPPYDYNQIDPGVGHRHKFGMEQFGRDAMAEMRRMGMIIDIDHMSEKAAAWTLEDMRASSYPVVSGHSSFRELSPRRRWGDESHPRSGQREVTIEGVPGPTSIEEPDERASWELWAHESEKTATQLQQIARLRGMVAPITGGLHDSRSFGDQVMNTLAGSSRTWAQEFLYARNVMGERGIGLGTDAVALLAQPGPRFGPQASWGLRLEHEPEVMDRGGKRRRQADLQTNGVTYDRPIKDYRAYRFFGRDMYDWEERDIWEATAMVKAGINPRVVTPDRHGPGAGNRTDDIQNKINNIAKGFFANSDGELERPFVFGGDTFAEQRAAFLVKTMYPGTPPGEARVTPPALASSEENRVRELFPRIWKIWNMWDRMEHDHTGAPNNVPLVRPMDGERDFDVNIDGVAHYGLFPDFLQDLSNVGLTESDLAVLFRSAEDYILVWERCQARSLAPESVLTAEQLSVIRQAALG